MIKEKTMWETSDGRLHNDAETAQAHQDLLNIVANLPGIYGRLEGCNINYEDFIFWVTDNKKHCADLFRILLQSVLKGY